MAWFGDDELARVGARATSRGDETCDRKASGPAENLTTTKLRHLIFPFEI